MNDYVIHGANFSEVWARAFLKVAKKKRREIRPLVVTIDTTFGIQERADVLNLLGASLALHGEATVNTVASTIFPISLWNPNRPRQALFDRYNAIWPKIKKVSANRNGTYFRRFVAFGETQFNQIEHVLNTWAQGNHRRSALQLAVFDPACDHTDQRQRGFPCLHQVALVPGSDGLLTLTAFYATQTLFEKAYGNYLGLARLGDFLARELGMRLSSITCVASVAMLTQLPAFEKSIDAFRDKLSALVQEGP